MHRFLLVRHATAGSGEDPGLSAEGQAEAAALAKRLAGWTVDAAWSSDMRRAIETARTIMETRRGPDLRMSPLLREAGPPPGSPLHAGYAEWEGDTVAGLAIDLSEWLELATAGPAGDGPDVCPTILVVSHAGPLRVLTCLLLGLSVEAQWSFRMDRASITTIEWAGDMGTLTLLNDRGHLESK